MPTRRQAKNLAEQKRNASSSEDQKSHNELGTSSPQTKDKTPVAEKESTTCNQQSPEDQASSSAVKSKRTRRKKPSEEPTVDESCFTPPQDNSAAIPPKKRKGNRMVECETSSVAEKEVSETSKTGEGDVAQEEKSPAGDMEIKPIELDEKDEESDLGETANTKPSAPDRADEGTNAVQPTLDENASPSQKANIKSQRPRASCDSPVLPSNILICPVCEAYCVQLVRHLRTHHGDHKDLAAMIKQARTMEMRAQPKETPGQNTSGSKAPKRQPVARPKNVQCPLCMKIVKRYDFNKHVRNVHSGEKPNKCPHCDYSTPWKGNLNTHIRGVHMRDRPHQCPSCSLAFKTRGALIGHVRKIHEGMYQVKERPFECETCHKMFFKKYHLERHVRIHTGEKPFACCFCIKKFSSKTNMDTHMQSVHLKIKPFKCGYCEKGFMRRKQLVEHLANHEGNPCQRKITSRVKRKSDEDEVEGDGHTVLLVRNSPVGTEGEGSDASSAVVEAGGSASAAPSKPDHNQTIVWRVQLPDGSQELHIRTCESEQTPQVLLIPQNQQQGGESDVIVLQPVQANLGETKAVNNAQGLQVIQSSQTQAPPMANLQQNNAGSADITGQAVAEKTDLASPDLVSAVSLPSSVSSVIPNAASDQQTAPIEETDSAQTIQSITDAANLHIIQGQDGEEAIAISVLTPDRIPQSSSSDTEGVPVIIPSSALASHIIETSQSEPIAAQIGEDQTQGLGTSQEYFYQAIQSAWPSAFNQPGQAFQGFQANNSEFQFEVSSSQTFTNPSAQAHFTTFANNGQSFTPIEPQPGADLPTNFNVHHMEKTFQIVTPQGEPFHENMAVDSIPSSGADAIQIVNESSQDQQSFF